MNKLFAAAFSLLIVLFSGCADEVAISAAIAISPVISRVSGANFESGDKIGLTIERVGANFADNVLMSYDGSSFFASSLVWYNNANQGSTFTAYHPYNSSGRPAEFTILADQSVGVSSSDLLVAIKNDVKPTSSPVKMVFRHMLTQLVLALKNTSQAAISEVIISELRPTAMVDYTLGQVTVKSAAAVADTKCFALVAGSEYRAIVVPQQATMQITVPTDDGKSRSKTLAKTTLEGGKQYDIAVLVSDVDIEIVLSGQIEDWAPGGPLDDSDTGGGSPSEDQDIIYQGVRYATKTFADKVWMAENLCYIPDNALIGSGIWYPSKDSSPSNDPDYIRQRGMLYSYDTATCGVTTTRSNQIKGICPDGWHIPSVAEYETLFAGGDALSTFFTFAGVWIGGGERYGDQSGGYALTSEVDQETKQISVANFTTMQVVQFDNLNGVSLRCVKD